METHIHTREGYASSSINTRGYTSFVGVQHGNIQSHWVYKLRESPAWKHTFTQEEDMQAPALIQEDIQASWESSMEKYNHTGYTSSVRVQHGNTHSHKRRICKPQH